MTVDKGEPEGITVRIRGYGITLPTEFMDALDWCYGDEIDITTTENCFDWGEVKGLILRNLTKEREEIEESNGGV